MIRGKRRRGKEEKEKEENKSMGYDNAYHHTTKKYNKCVTIHLRKGKERKELMLTKGYLLDFLCVFCVIMSPC